SLVLRDRGRARTTPALKRAMPQLFHSESVTEMGSIASRFFTMNAYVPGSTTENSASLGISKLVPTCVTPQASQRTMVTIALSSSIRICCSRDTVALKVRDGRNELSEGPT